VAEDSSAWRDIGALAALVGHYAWLEEQIFTLTGAWASGTGVNSTGVRSTDESPEGAALVAEAQVWSAAASRRHGLLATRWVERLPVRAGVDAAALVRAPSDDLAAAFAALGQVDDAPAGAAVLAGTVLPWLGGIYLAHLQVASAVTESSVAEVLLEARRIGVADTTGGQSIVRNLGDESELRTRTGDLVTQFAQIVDTLCVFPAVPTS
jgi:hypothetical protein